MRIAHALRASVAVLYLAVLFISVCCRVPGNASFTPERFRHSRNLAWSQQMSLRDKQLYIMQEANVHWNGAECCPTKREMTEPLGGTNEQGVHVTLYRDGNEKNRQRFYEFSCVEGVENQPCRFMDKKFLNQSRCVQQYSYSYALLKDTAAYDPSNGRAPFYFERKNHTWMLGYIKVRSGCKCIMTPKRTKKSKSKRLMQPADEGPT